MADTSRRDFILQSAAVTTAVLVSTDAPAAGLPGGPVVLPDWVHDITRMSFLHPTELDRAARAGAQVVHTNVAWPYFPLRKDGGGGLSHDDAKKLHDLVNGCHDRGMK